MLCVLHAIHKLLALVTAQRHKRCNITTNTLITPHHTPLRPMDQTDEKKQKESLPKIGTRNAWENEELNGRPIKIAAKQAKIPLRTAVLKHFPRKRVPIAPVEKVRLAVLTGGAHRLDYVIVSIWWFCFWFGTGQQSNTELKFADSTQTIQQ